MKIVFKKNQRWKRKKKELERYIFYKKKWHLSMFLIFLVIRFFVPKYSLPIPKWSLLILNPDKILTGVGTWFLIHFLVFIMILIRDDNVDRPVHRGLDCFVLHNLCGLQSLVHSTHHLACELADWSAFYLFFNFFLFFIIKLSMFKNCETLRNSQN